MKVGGLLLLGILGAVGTCATGHEVTTAAKPVNAGHTTPATALSLPALAVPTSTPPADNLAKTDDVVPAAPAADRTGAAPTGVMLAATDPTTVDDQDVPSLTDTDEDEGTPTTPTPEGPHRVLILGDSLAATGFGALLERQLDAQEGVVCYRRGKSSSGLARPDFFDWLAEAERQVEFRQPELVVVIMGGNDGQDLTPKGTSGRRVTWNDESWADEYRKRVDRFLSAVLSSPERKVLWLELPTMGLNSLERKLELIRSVQKDAVAALGERGVYLATTQYVADSEGNMLTHAKVGASSKKQPIRADDKIHFTMLGSEYFADQIFPEVLNVLGIAPSAPSEE